MASSLTTWMGTPTSPLYLISQRLFLQGVCFSSSSPTVSSASGHLSMLSPSYLLLVHSPWFLLQPRIPLHLPRKAGTTEHPDLQTWQHRNAHSLKWNMGWLGGWGWRNGRQEFGRKCIFFRRTHGLGLSEALPTYLQWSPNTLETSKDLCSSYLSSCAQSQLRCMASLDEVPRSVRAAHGLHCSLAFGLFISPVRIEPTSPALHGAFSTTGLPGKSPLLQFCPLSEPLPLCSG